MHEAFFVLKGVSFLSVEMDLFFFSTVHGSKLTLF